MLVRLRMNLAFDIEKRTQVEALRDAILPFLQYAKNINAGLPNEETGYIEVESCGHEDALPCEIVAKWEVGTGRVI